MSDEWAQDPSIRFMRRVFRRMEANHGQVMDRAEISPFDLRLRRWRNEARNRFEQGWALAAKRGLILNEERAGVLYAVCLVETLRLQGISIPVEGLAQDEDFLKLLREVKS